MVFVRNSLTGFVLSCSGMIMLRTGIRMNHSNETGEIDLEIEPAKKNGDRASRDQFRLFDGNGPPRHFSQSQSIDTGGAGQDVGIASRQTGRSQPLSGACRGSRASLEQGTLDDRGDRQIRQGVRGLECPSGDAG